MIEIFLALLTAVAFQVCDNVLHRKGAFIAAAATVWTAYVWVRWRREPAVLRDWGFRRAGLLPASAAALAVLGVGTAGMVAWAAAAYGPVRLPGHFWLLVWLYPAWGLVQQFLLNAMVARNVRRLAPRAPAWLIVLGVAVLFGAIHLPDRLLAALTAAAAAVWVPIYLRWRNLWPLAVCHGVLAAVAYFVVLRKDPWAEVVASLR